MSFSMQLVLQSNNKAVFRPIPLWEEWVMRASGCGVKLLSFLFRVRARDPLNIIRGVPSNRRTVTRVRQKHLNSWWWCCFMVRWRTDLVFLNSSWSTHFSKPVRLIKLMRSVTRKRAPDHSPAGRRTAVRPERALPAQCGLCPSCSKPLVCLSNNNGFSTAFVSWTRL